MNFKIIETESNFPEVLLYRDRNERGDEIVKILAIGTIRNESDMFAEETIKFENADSAKNFIFDFTITSANDFCRRNWIEYE